MGQDHDPKIANSELLLTLTAMMQVIGDKNLAEIIEELNIGIDLANLPADDFSLTFPARNYARLVSKIESTYSGGGIRILSRIGRSMFHQVLREQPNSMASARRTMGIWNPARRIVLILEAINDLQSQAYPQRESWIENRNGRVSLIEQDCLECYGRHNSSPVCHMRIGFLNEAVHWATDREYIFQETACIAAGEPFCCFVLTTSRSKTTQQP